MKMKPTTWLILGLVCAVGAVLLVKKYLAQPAAAPPPMPITNILIATRTIPYAAPLILSEDKDKRNVVLWEWPEQMVPEGAIKTEEEIIDKNLLTNKEFFQYEPILTNMLLPKEQIVPEGWVWEEFPVDEKLLKHPLIKAGRHVDIQKVMNRELEDFLVCVLIYGIHFLPTEYDEEAAQKPNVMFLLLPQDLDQAWLEANMKYKFVVRPSTRDCSGGPRLVVPIEQEKRVEFDELCKKLDQALEGEQWKDGLALAEKIKGYETWFPQEVSRAVQKGRSLCVDSLAAGLHAELEGAWGAKNYPKVLEIKGILERDYPEATEYVNKARARAEEAKDKVANLNKEEGYRDAITAMDDAIQTGNLPGARELLGAFQENYGAYRPAALLKDPEELMGRWRKQLLIRENDFQQYKRLFDYYLRAKNQEKALEKLLVLEKDFPKHPETAKCRAGYDETFPEG